MLKTWLYFIFQGSMTQFSFIYLFILTNLWLLPLLFFFPFCSILFLILSIITNTTLTFKIITHENTKPKFYRWFIENNKVASIPTALACADIQALKILQSNFAGLHFQILNAPFSDSTNSKIFWVLFWIFLLKIFLK